MTPVVLIHGIRLSSSMWQAQLAAVEATGRPAIAVDLPGHGTRADDAFTIDAAMAVVDAAVQRLGGRAVVVGLSLGGYVAGASHDSILEETPVENILAMFDTVKEHGVYRK